MKIKVKNIIMATTILVLPVVATVNAFAEVLSFMSVSPPYQRMILIPGETYTGEISISNSNENKNTLKYSASVGSFSETGSADSKDDYGTVDHLTKTDYNQIMDWIVLDKKTGEVPTNETDVLTYKINVPENAPAGGQYATILIKDETNSGGDDAGNVTIQNVMQFGSIIYAEVAGETNRDGAVIENNVPVVSFGSPIVVSSVVKNAGNVHTDAKYTLQVWPLFSDTEVYSNEEKPKTSLILPQSERYNTMSWDEAPAVGIFKVKQTVEIFGNVSVVEKIVVICPLWLVFVIVAVIIGVIVWLMSRKKARNRKTEE